MATIQNTWIEKIRKKRAPETAASYESNPIDSWLPLNPSKQVKRFSHASSATMLRTLRGVRK